MRIVRKPQIATSTMNTMSAILVGLLVMVLDMTMADTIPMCGRRIQSFNGNGPGTGDCDNCTATCGSSRQFGKYDGLFRRITSSRYDMDSADNLSGGNTMSHVANRPNVRKISNILCRHEDAPDGGRSSDGFSDFVWSWGQFLDHDIDLTGGGGNRADIPVEVEDQFPGNQCSEIRFTRSGSEAEPDPMTCDMQGDGDFITDCIMNNDGSLMMQQFNHITGFVDASNVYGSNEDSAINLREFVDGRMRVSGTDGMMLPRQCPTCRNFLAGDSRNSENFGLISMHTLWVREHNRLAREIKLHFFPDSTSPLTGDDDEEIYQLARKYVIYQIQIVTYREFLPALLGEDDSPKVEDYSYDQGLDCRISNEFATAAYRFGHSMLSDNLHLIDVDGTQLGDVSLFASFFRGDFLDDGPLNIENGDDFNTAFMTGPAKVDAVLNGLRLSTAQETDRHVVDSVREFLFDTNGAEGSSRCLDLPSLNLQRGRDHGLPTYKEMCEIMGTATINTFDDIPTDADTIEKFKLAYDSVDQVDLWMGLISESHSAGAGFGPLAIKLMNEQFTRLRDGDPNFYTPCSADDACDSMCSDWAKTKLADLEKTTLSRVLMMNTGIMGLTGDENVFYVNGVGPSGLGENEGPSSPVEPIDITPAPTSTPSDDPSSSPSSTPSAGPSATPSASPSANPSSGPTSAAPMEGTAAPVDPTMAPVTNSPVTNAPVTEAPVTEAPVTEAPVTAEPTMAPFTQSPTMQSCGTDMFKCPDGTFVARNTMKNCDFDDCPTMSCEESSKVCWDGSTVVPDPHNFCEFESCPPEPVVCATDTFECPDGTFVSRDNENNCNFKECPPTNPTGCADDISLLKSMPETGAPSFLPGTLPVKIISQDIETVTVEVSQVWCGSVQDMFVSYHKGAFHDVQCQNYKYVSRQWTEQVEIQCIGSSHMAELKLYIQDSSLLNTYGSNDDMAIVPQCCHADYPDQAAAEYIFLIACETKCTSESY